MNEDRFIAGYISGTIASLLQEAFMAILKNLGWTDRAYYDFGKAIIMLRPYKGSLAFVIGLIAHLVLGGMMGYLFALLVKTTSSKYFLFKTLIWGPFLWFITLGAGTIFRIPTFSNIPPLPAFITLIGSIIYSFVNGFVLRYLDKKTPLS